MKIAYLSFLKKLMIFTLVIALISFAVIYFLPDSFVSPTIPYQVVFFLALTIIIHYILLKTMMNKARNFINLFMLLTFGKLLFLLTVVLLYIFINRDDAVRFVIPFFVLYLLFTGFEVIQSLKLAQEANKRNKP